MSVLTKYLMLSKSKLEHIVFEGTFRKKLQRNEIVEIAKSNGAEVSIVYVKAKDEILKERITARYNRGEQAATYETHLKVKKSYEIPDNAYMVDNSSTFQELENSIDLYINQCKR